MRKCIKKMAAVLACALVFQAIPMLSASVLAAEKPAFKSYRKTIYENGASAGVYSYTLKNLKKGYLVKWSAAGAGKDYISFDKDIVTASKTTVSNKIALQTEGNTAAKNKDTTITAKVYDTSGKLLATVKDKVKIKVSATDIAIKTTKIQDNLNALSVNTAYDFDRTLTPANATSKTYWTVKDAKGQEVANVINSSGVFTPTQLGDYTIVATARNSATSKILKTAEEKVRVGVGISRIEQTAANKINVIFNSNVKDTVTKNDFTIKTSDGSTSIDIKSLSASQDGRTITLVTGSSFKDGVSYTITYKELSSGFTAAAGDPVTAEILTSSVPVNVATPIKYALYDQKGIDVSSSAKGTVSFAGDVTNGYITSNNELFMTTIGKTTEVTLTYTAPDNSRIVATGKIICKEYTGEEASATQFTITSDTKTPDFTESNFQENRYVSVEDKAYAYFRALDENGNELTFNSITYSSTDDEILIISPEGMITPIRKGTATITVTVSNGVGKTSYSFNITVRDRRTPSLLSLSPTNLTMSNAYVDGYEKYVNLTLMDQYGDVLPLNNCNVTIEEVSNRGIFAAYDSERQRIVVSPKGVAAGMYAFKITVYQGAASTVQMLTVEVRSIPSVTNYSYVPEITDNQLDMAINENTSKDKTVTVRLARYAAGVFVDYVDFNSASIKKGDAYYTQDLTSANSTSASTTATIQNGTLTITAVKVDTTNAIGEVKKAETGTYSIILKYYADGSTAQRTSNVALTLTDTQTAPRFTVKSSTPAATMGNALSLVENCIKIDSGYFTSCTAIGTTKKGSDIELTSGQKIHIKTVSIRDTMEIAKSTGNPRKVYLDYVVDVNRTFTNK